MKDLLLELGVEEVPARFLSPALSALEAGARACFDQAGLASGQIRALGTPRRLALLVEGLADKARDLEQEFLGPALAQAKDAEGNWTPAAQGFARAQGVAPEVLSFKETDRGPRLAHVKKMPGLPAEKLLPALLAGLIRGLAFPKSMVWEESRLAFVRPLRWIVALHGARPVAFSLAGVKAGRRTLGLRFHSLKPFDVPLPGRYATLLKNHCVIVDPEERRSLIVKQIHQAAKHLRGHVPVEAEPALLEEVANLVEHPVAVVGKFDDRFLAIPKEVLITSMKKHQKFFPVYKDESLSALLPAFVGIRNGLSDNQSVVREGYERVLAARLSDAAFFFDQDRRRSLESRVENLRGVAFLSPRLSLFDKAERMGALVERWARGLGLSGESAAEARRIALLAKADLTTGMVGEFPELQGVMGRLYAAAEGEPPAVARGVEEHYWPLAAEGELPGGDAASLAAIADKADTLAGNFLRGKTPSGSQDPYGLRRAAVGILRILEARRWALSMAEITDRALEALPEDLGDRARAAAALKDFFRQRWAALAEGRGFKPDEVEAVAAAGLDPVSDAWARLAAVRDIRRLPGFAPFSVAFKRAANLLKQAEKKGEGADAVPREALFLTEAERALDARLKETRARVDPFLAAGDYAGALAVLVELRGPVDDFFTQAVVMDPDADVRRNRLGLLARVKSFFDRVADFSQLQD